MTAIPIPPTFTAGAPPLTQLNALSACVSFVADGDVRPFYHAYQNANQTIVSAATWTTLTFGTAVYDNDGMLSSPGVKVVTQGYYGFECCVPFVTPNSALCAVAFLATAGASNPHYTSGTTVRFGYAGSSTPAPGGTYDGTVTTADLCPWVLYPGDTVVVQGYSSTASMVAGYNNNTGSTYSGRFSKNFTACYIRTGS